MNPAVEVKNACFRYGDAVIFEDINLTLKKGEMLCVLGPNGCGKTTLLDTILGYHRPYRGSIAIDGREIRSYSRAGLAKQIAYVPQIHEKSFPFRVLEIVVMGRTPHLPAMSSPSARDYEIAHEALDAIGISHLSGRIYTTLSGGETQLVILARALAQDAPVIIMDEPAAHLDFRHEFVLLRLVAGLIKEKNLSVIMSTHSPNHAFFLENTGIPVRIALMYDKRIVAEGAPGTTISRENIMRIYDIDSRIFSNTIGGTRLNYIVPLNGAAAGRRQ